MDKWFSERGPGMGQEFKILEELCYEVGETTELTFLCKIYTKK